MTEVRTGRMTVADLDALPDERGTRYELFDGELYVSRQPHHEHQRVTTNISGCLWDWNRRTNLGQVFGAPGLVFSAVDAAAPDVAWASHERLARIADSAAPLHGAPELIVEVLSPGAENVRRDREVKLDAYSRHGVDEYWIVDRVPRTVEVYRRDGTGLRFVATFAADEVLTSPVLPGFAVPVGEFFG